jgi:hypothetical protein
MSQIDEFIRQHPPAMEPKEFNNSDFGKLEPWIKGLVRNKPTIDATSVIGWIQQYQTALRAKNLVLPTDQPGWEILAEKVKAFLAQSRRKTKKTAARKKGPQGKTQGSKLEKILQQYVPIRKQRKPAKKKTTPENPKTGVVEPPRGTSPGLACICFGRMHPDPECPLHCGDTFRENSNNSPAENPQHP